MNIILHLPKDKSRMNALQRNLAEAHAKSVLDSIQKKQLSEEDCKKLVSMICDRTKSTSVTYGTG